MTNRAHVLTAGYAGMLQKRGYSLVCHHCGRPCELGQIVVTKSSHNAVRANTSRVYHVECWDSLFMDFPDDSPEELTVSHGQRGVKHENR